MKVSYSKFKSLIPASVLNALALEYKLNAKNQVKLPGQLVFLCLLNGILNHPELSLRMLEEHYKKITGKNCDHSSFGKRLAMLNPDYFRAILAHLHSCIGPLLTKTDMKSLKLRICDATIVTLSAKLLNFGIKANHGNKGEKRQIKSVVELSDEGLPNLLHICDNQSEFSDNKALGAIMISHAKADDLWVFDKGCNGKRNLLSLHESGTYWISPKSNQGVEVLEEIYEQDKGVTPADIADKRETDLVVDRVEEAIFASKHHENVRGIEFMKIIIIHCYRWNMRKKSWESFVLITNLPLSSCKTKAGPYTFEEVTDIYGRRWEIETFFKLIKEHLGFEHLTSRCENGITIMVIMAMITALVMKWYSLQTDIRNGWKAVKFWLADDVRAWTTRSINLMNVWEI